MAKIPPVFNTLNPKAGQQTHHIIEVPIDFVLIIESDEQRPLFMGHNSITKQHYSGDLLITRHTLPVGDYSCKGFTDKEGIVIERKSVSDLYSSMFSDWEREKKKLEKIAGYFRKWLVVEALECDVLRYQEYSKVSPNSMRGKLADIELRLGIPIYYADGRLEAEKFILYRLCKFHRLKRSGDL